MQVTLIVLQRKLLEKSSNPVSLAGNLSTTPAHCRNVKNSPRSTPGFIGKVD